MMEVRLGLQKEVSLVDDADFELVSQYKWYIHRFKKQLYARRPVFDGEKRRWEKLSIFLLGKRDGLVIDHINGNGLDNRRENLRYATARENRKNNIQARNGKLTGTQKTASGKYSSTIILNGKAKCLGTYPTEQEAFDAYAREEAAFLNSNH